MPTNKSAQERYIIYDQCFSDTINKYTKEDLKNLIIEKLGQSISERTFRKDIEDMEAMASDKKPGVTINRDPFGIGNKRYYHYSEPFFRIYGDNLTKDELKSIRTAIEILGRFRGVSNYSWVNEEILKLENRLGIKPNTEKVVEFEQNDNYTGLQWLPDVIEATINHKPLIISYTPFNKEQIRKKFYPYYVKQYNNRWFVLGREYGKETITTYALDRIDGISTSLDKFEPNNLVYFPDLFKDIIGVTLPDKDTKLETITLRFSEKRFPYVVTKPLHRSQEIINDDEFTISIKVKPTKELDQKILSFGPDVTVLSPVWYREYMCKKIEETIENYKK